MNKRFVFAAVISAFALGYAAPPMIGIARSAAPSACTPAAKAGGNVDCVAIIVSWDHSLRKLDIKEVDITNTMTTNTIQKPNNGGNFPSFLRFPHPVYVGDIGGGGGPCVYDDQGNIWC